MMKQIKKVLWGAAIATLSLGSLNTVATAAGAQAALSNGTVQFPEDTVIEFELIDTHGFYQSTFGVIDGRTNRKVPLFVETRPYDRDVASVPGRDDTGTLPDFLGTVQGGGVVNGQGQASNLIRYTFKAGTPYAFYLESVDPRTKVAKTSYLSTNNLAARFRGSLTSGATGNLIEWDDSGLPKPGRDGDFDDFAIIAGGFEVLPCPLTRALEPAPAERQIEAAPVAPVPQAPQTAPVRGLF